MNSAKIIPKEGEIFKITGTRMRVHRIMGSGFLKTVFQEALEKEIAHE